MDTVSLKADAEAVSGSIAVRQGASTTAALADVDAGALFGRKGTGAANDSAAVCPAIISGGASNPAESAFIDEVLAPHGCATDSSEFSATAVGAAYATASKCAGTAGVGVADAEMEKERGAAGGAAVTASSVCLCAEAPPVGCVDTATAIVVLDAVTANINC
jgi:hypothetical protein